MLVETREHFNSMIGENVKLARDKSKSRSIVMAQNRYDSKPCVEVSDWALEIMEEVSCYLGVSFEGVDEQAMDLFSALE